MGWGQTNNNQPFALPIWGMGATNSNQPFALHPFMGWGQQTIISHLPYTP